MESNFDSIEELIVAETFQKFVLRPEQADKDFWEDWMQGDPERTSMIAEAREVVLALAHQLPEEEIDEERRQLRRLLTSEPEPQKVTFTEPNKAEFVPAPKQRFQIPAFLLAIGMFIFSAIFLFNHFKPEPPPLVFQTEYGETLSREFPDGSMVYLNANSKLYASRVWSEDAPRKFKLEGEAYFYINPNPLVGKKECVISTTSGEVQVLGTAFNLRDRKNDFELVLTEGLVDLNLVGQPRLRMKKGEKVSLYNQQFQTGDVDSEMYTAWKDHKMIFKDAAMHQVIRRLKDDFNIEITLQNKSILKKNITASIPNDDPELLLQALQEIYQFQLDTISPGSFLIR